MNLALNPGAFQLEDTCPSHPHITLAQGISPDHVGSAVETARRRLAGYSGARAFPVDRLTFTRNSLDRGWLDLDEFGLPSGPHGYSNSLI